MGGEQSLLFAVGVETTYSVCPNFTKNINEKQQKSYLSSVKIWSVDANGHSPLSSLVTDSYLLFIVSAL